MRVNKTFESDLEEGGSFGNSLKDDSFASMTDYSRESGHRSELGDGSWENNWRKTII